MQAQGSPIIVTVCLDAGGAHNHHAFEAAGAEQI